MKLTIAGGGGFRVPQVLDVLSHHDDVFQIREVTLYDVSASRLEVMTNVIRDLYGDRPDLPTITTTTDLESALPGSDFVFSAIRVGGTSGRVLDERVALEQHVIGQETIGPGGQSYALRTLPEAMRLAHAVKQFAPQAWVINFTNPAGIITQAMRTVLGRKVIGICDTPIGLMRKACAVLEVHPSDVTFDYVGLNHLGWLRTLEVDGTDRLPEILARDELLAQIEEARILGFDWVRTLGMLPNEYLFYYYYARESRERVLAQKQTRGEFLRNQQESFYQAALEDPDQAGALWNATLNERESTYMAESRPESERAARRQEDLGGGYQEVAFNIMKAIVHNEPATMILNVANADLEDNDGGRNAHVGRSDTNTAAPAAHTGGTDLQAPSYARDAAAPALLIPGLSLQAVVEVPCTVDANGVHPHRVAPLTGPEFGLVCQVKTAEEQLLSAFFSSDENQVWRAMASHPLVDSVAIARKMLDGYLDH